MKDLGSKGRAGLPQDVKFTDVKRQPHVGSEIDDTMTGIDETISKSVGKAKSHKSNQK